ncbi:MAG: hypothetical protein ACR2OU_07485, partial [Thermomicrobiales bacterium]
MPDFFPVNFNTLIALGGIIFALSYTVKQYRMGGKQASLDLIVQLQEQLKAQQEINASIKEAHMHQLAQLQEQLKMQQEQINTLSGAVGVLQGEKNANEQKLKEYLEIIGNRNPDLEKTLNSLEVFIHDALPIINEIRNSSLKNTDHPLEHTTTTNTTSTTVDQPRK